MNKLEKKISAKKMLKEKDLFEAAYDLFISKGFQNTAIDDIVKKAGVAKGTFYLYFKDKYDIIDRIILKKSAGVLRGALEGTLPHQCDSFEDKMIYFIDNIIESLRKDKGLLKLLYKNLSWGLFRKAIANPDENREMKYIMEILTEDMKKSGYSIQDIEMNLFMIIELTGSVCYSAIILEEPDNIDAMKPVLFNTIKKILVK
jgi:AcrR family transcriptional regulator